MKTAQKFRNTTGGTYTEDLLKKPAKLDPIKKSGKEKRSIYNALDDDEGDEPLIIGKRESILDYFEDEEEDL